MELNLSPVHHFTLQLAPTMGVRMLRILMCASLCVALNSCVNRSPLPAGGALENKPYLPAPDLVFEIEGMSHCTSVDDARLHINKGEPVTLIVHGCFLSAGRFRALADVFAFHGQQTICFNYDDRDRISDSAAQLNQALAKLSEKIDTDQITVIGHSQGGLVARQSVSEFNDAQALSKKTKISLATISGPFGGIESSKHCGWRWLHLASFGITTAVCQAVTGSKWTEIPPDSRFIQNPTPLNTNVVRFLKINTDETETCRRHDAEGRCIEDDYVFSLAEQSHPVLDQLEIVKQATVKAGHVEIVGDSITAPDKLIRVLQQGGYMRDTPAERQAAFRDLLDQLYVMN